MTTTSIAANDYRGHPRADLEALREELGRDTWLGQVAHWSDDALADRLDRRAAADAAWAARIAAGAATFSAVRSAGARRAGGAR